MITFKIIQGNLRNPVFGTWTSSSTFFIEADIPNFIPRNKLLSLEELKQLVSEKKYFNLSEKTTSYIPLSTEVVNKEIIQRLYKLGTGVKLIIGKGNYNTSDSTINYKTSDIILSNSIKVYINEGLLIKKEIKSENISNGIIKIELKNKIKIEQPIEICYYTPSIIVHDNNSLCQQRREIFSERVLKSWILNPKHFPGRNGFGSKFDGKLLSKYFSYLIDDNHLMDYVV